MIFLSELNDCRQSDYGKATKICRKLVEPHQVERPLDFSPSPVSPVGEVDLKVESLTVRSFQKVNWKLQAFHAPCFALPPSAHSCRSKRQDSRFFFGVFFHFRAVLPLALVTSAPLRKKGRESVCVIQTVLSYSPERKRERERDNTARCGSISEVYAHQTQINPSSLSLQVSPVARALSITPRVPSSPGDSIVNFVEEEAGLQEGTDPTRTTPQSSKAHAIRKKNA